VLLLRLGGESPAASRVVNPSQPRVEASREEDGRLGGVRRELLEQALDERGDLQIEYTVVISDVSAFGGAHVFDLSGKTALVTGAGQNVGAGIARALATQGATVVVNDLIDERAEATASAIREASGSADTAVFDVTDRAAVESAVTAIGSVDILVNNAGNAGAERMGVAPFIEMAPEQWEGPIRVNLYGVLNCCWATVPGMVDRGWGRVITISSGAGTGGVNIGVATYSAGKGGGIAFTRTLALEVARSGVTANSLAIGMMGMPDRTVSEGLARRVPVGRTGTPEDIAAACVWLASDEAGWVTAQTIQVNGGSITT
jgi:NAD(P)-dependent dehydrogenase (short-subunit alcohol dehydrogenase family)